MSYFISHIFYSKTHDNLCCSSCNVTFCSEELFDHICFITHCKYCGKMNCDLQHCSSCGKVDCKKQRCSSCGSCKHKTKRHCDWCDALDCKLNHCYKCGYENCRARTCGICEEKECSEYHKWSCSCSSDCDD